MTTVALTGKTRISVKVIIALDYTLPYNPHKRRDVISVSDSAAKPNYTVIDTYAGYSYNHDMDHDLGHDIGSPFPGMDPYLEHPALWPDVHTRLIAAIADVLAPQVAPKYYVGLEWRTYLLKPDDIGRPDIVVVERQPAPLVLAPAVAGVAFLDVEVPLNDEVGETFLEVHEVV